MQAYRVEEHICNPRNRQGVHIQSTHLHTHTSTYTRPYTQTQGQTTQQKKIGKKLEHFAKEYIQMANKLIQKVFNFISYQGKTNFKTQDTTIPSPELLNLEDREYHTLVRKWGNWNSHTLLVGVQIKPTILENFLDLQKVNVFIPHDPAL